MLEFTALKFSGLDGKTKVRRTANRGDFYVEADQVGLVLKGELVLEERADLEPLAKAIGTGWKDHLSLKPKFETSLSGH